MSEQNIRQRRRQVQVEPTQAEVAAAAAEGLTVHEGFISVQRVAYGQTEESRETIQVPLFATQPARVRVVAGTTRNLGDYNSARVEVMVELPCYPEDGEIRRAYAYASTVLDELIPVELAKAGVQSGEDTHQ